MHIVLCNRVLRMACDCHFKKTVVKKKEKKINRAGDITSKFKKNLRVKFLQTVLSGPTEAFKYVIASTCSRQCSPGYLRREKSERSAKSVAAVHTTAGMGT